MKPVQEMSSEEFAAWVCAALSDAGITVTLTGGTCVSIWAEGKYVSNDLDFIEEGPVTRAQIRKVLTGLGFTQEKGRHFVHPDSEFFVEFPTGPLMIGEQRVERVETRQTPQGTLRLLSPTDCVKDRLAAYYHWNDQQALEQAKLVAAAQLIDLDDVRRWSIAEGHQTKFEAIKAQLRTQRSARQKRKPK